MLAQGGDKNLLSRRRFLAQTAAVSAGVAGYGLLSNIGWANVGWASERLSNVGPRDWDELERRLTPGALLRPGNPGYEDAARPNNLRYASVLPEGIARCTNAKDVAQSIDWCREYGVPLAPRSGGHNYAGYSTTTGLLIDVSPMTATSFDRATGILTVGGGAKNADVYAYLPQFNAAITHGRCKAVGVAGLVLGGGIGFNMRARGLTCDQLVESQIVTADGQQRTISEKQNSSLFWACRGGAGGNFGINTSFSFQTFPVGVISAFKFKWVASPEKVYPALLAALEKGPPELGSRVGLVALPPNARKPGQDFYITLLGQLVGTPQQVDAILQSVYDIAKPTLSDEYPGIEQKPYWEAQELLSEEGEDGYYQERSRFFGGPFKNAAIATAFHWIRNWPGNSRPDGTQMALFQTGAKINEMPAHKTAFVHRSSDWLMTIAMNWTGKDSERTLRLNHAWQNSFYRTMLPFASGGAYQNFPDPSLDDWKKDYYGDNLKQLETVKAMVDPKRLFLFPQAIPPA
jgi:FAD/FMN-containing dehydrogenase